MKRPTTKSKGSGRDAKRGSAKSTNHEAIAATMQSIEQIKAESPASAGVVELLKGWLQDDSGYDEKTWPKLKKALNEERTKVGARRLFDD